MGESQRMADEKCHYWRGILHNKVVDEMNNILGETGRKERRETDREYRSRTPSSLNLPHTNDRMN
jgi:hypothetical protein